MLTLTEEEIASGILAGADDVIIRPLQHREFILRIRSLVHVHEEKVQLMRSRDLLGEHARVSESC